MTAVLYPVAASAEAALNAPLGRAARERDAEKMAEAHVVFETQAVGPAFETREAALDAYAGRVEDDRPGRTRSVDAEDRYCRLTPYQVREGRAAPARPVEPVNRDGRRWPEPKAAARTAWRLSIGFWRIAEAGSTSDGPQARLARRKGGDPALDAESLRALTRQPLRPVRPQQALDIGLFETRLPEAPHIIIADE